MTRDPLHILGRSDVYHSRLLCARYALHKGIVWPYANNIQGTAKTEGYKFNSAAARDKGTIHNTVRALAAALEGKERLYRLVVACNPSASAYAGNLANRMGVEYIVLGPEDDTKDIQTPSVPLGSIYKKNVLLIKEVATQDSLCRVRAAANAFQRLGCAANHCITIFAGKGLGNTSYVRQEWTSNDRHADQHEPADTLSTRNTFGMRDTIDKGFIMEHRAVTTYMLLHDSILREGGKQPVAPAR